MRSSSTHSRTSLFMKRSAQLLLLVFVLSAAVTHHRVEAGGMFGHLGDAMLRSYDVVLTTVNTVYSFVADIFSGDSTTKESLHVEEPLSMGEDFRPLPEWFTEEEAPLVAEDLVTEKPKVVEKDIANEPAMITVKDFDLMRCPNYATPAVTIKHLRISPQHFSIPGTINVSTHIEFTNNFISPISGQIELKKKFGNFYIRLPCVDKKFGSCTYDDLCNLSPWISDSVSCPTQFGKLPCRCPFKRGLYVHTLTSLDVPKIDLGYPLAGHYKAVLKIGDLDCFEMSFSIEQDGRKLSLGDMWNALW